MKYFPEVVKFVNEAFRRAGDDHGIKHFERTVFWLRQLRPDADEAFGIAAYSHDIERAFRNQEVWSMQKRSDKGFRDEDFLRIHQERGAEIIGEFLQKRGAGEDMIARVKRLISKHEVGGDDEQNMLKDADSLSFFENNIPHFLTKKVAELNKEKVKAKFDWMFNRITSEKAREIARPWYEAAVGKLGY